MKESGGHFAWLPLFLAQKLSHREKYFGIYLWGSEKKRTFASANCVGICPCMMFCVAEPYVKLRVDEA